MKHVGFERRLQIVELKEIHNDSHKNSKNYKQRVKVFHDKCVMRKSFALG